VNVADVDGFCNDLLGFVVGTMKLLSSVSIQGLRAYERQFVLQSPSRESNHNEHTFAIANWSEDFVRRLNCIMASISRGDSLQILDEGC
jgi:DNA-binding transcriptional MerR regulator